MPYHVYALKPLGVLEHLAEFPAYAPASAHAKALRAHSALPAPPVPPTLPALPRGTRIKVIFADNRLQAEDLLQRTRERDPGTDD